MRPVDPSLATAAIARLASELPVDKGLHFVGTRALCESGVPLEDLDSEDGQVGPFSLLKEGLEAFAIGLAKEFSDAGAGESSAAREAAMELRYAVGCLGRARLAALEAGLGDPEHEGDLFADLLGVGSFLVSRSFVGLNWILGDYPE